MLPNVLKSCSEPSLCTVTLWHAQACRGNVWFPWWREHIPTISRTGVRQWERHSGSLLCSYIKITNSCPLQLCVGITGAGTGRAARLSCAFLLGQITSAPSIPHRGSGNYFWGCEPVEITEGLISQYSSKLNHNEFLVVLDICCDICSLFVLTETLQALPCQVQGNCRRTSRAGSWAGVPGGVKTCSMVNSPHLVRLGHFLGIGNAVVSLELIQSYVLSFDVH